MKPMIDISNPKSIAPFKNKNDMFQGYYLGYTDVNMTKLLNAHVPSSFSRPIMVRVAIFKTKLGVVQFIAPPSLGNKLGFIPFGVMTYITYSGKVKSDVSDEYTQWFEVQIEDTLYVSDLYKKRKK